MNKRVGRSIGIARDASGVKPTLHDCLDTFLAQADTLIDGVLEGLVTATKAQGGAAKHFAEPDEGMKAALRLVEQRVQVKARFTQSLHVGMFQGAGVDTNTRAVVKFEELRFFEEGQLDASIEHARIVEEIERAASEILPPTHAIMSSLLGWVSVQPSINPVRPEVFARALSDALGPDVNDSPSRERVYTIAGGYLGMGLAGMYRHNLDWLRSMGVEPAGLHGADAPVAKSANQPAGESSIAKTLLTLDRLRKLLTGNLDPGMPQMASLMAATGGRDFLHTVPASLVALQDMKQVEELVDRLAQKAKAGTNTPAEVAKQKSLAVELRLGKQLGRHLGNEVIRLMVEKLTQDDRLLAPIRQLLQQLEPQLLKLAHADQRFFSEKTHPARRLIERVVQRSFGFATVTDAGFVDFFKSVKLILSSLTLPTESVTQGFADAIELLEVTWAQHDAEQARKQQEAAKALLHAEQRNLLAQRVSGEMAERLKGKELPESVVHFLCSPWAQALAERQLSGAPASREYHGLADDLIWSVQKDLARRNPGKLVQMIPSMLRTMRQGLKVIDYPDLLTERFFEELIALHESSLDGVARKVHEQVDVNLQMHSTKELALPQQTAPAPVQAEDAFWVGQQEGQDIGFVDANSPGSSNDDVVESGFTEEAPAPSDLDIGTWVDLVLDGKTTRANLKWTSPYNNLFMFVSAGGSAHSMTRRTLDRLRANGSLRVVAHGEVVDQALDGVAQVALRNSLKDAGGGG